LRERRRHFDPSTYRDRYQEALQQLIEAKTKGLPIKPRAVSTPTPVIDLMAALKRSLAQELRAGAKNGKTEANQATIRSPSASLTSPLNRRSQEKSTALGRLGCQQD
jgi:DNA end-binding protein Ku